MARKRYPVLLDTTDENTNDFASLVRERWMEDTSILFSLYLLIAMMTAGVETHQYCCLH